MNHKTRSPLPPKTARVRKQRRRLMAHELMVYEDLDDLDIPEAALGPTKTTSSAN